MDKVVVTIPFRGICHMQVCAEKDATNEEILEVCNSKNPSGTTNGWGAVVREEITEGLFKCQGPVQCKADPERLHFMVSC